MNTSIWFNKTRNKNITAGRDWTWDLWLWVERSTTMMHSKSVKKECYKWILVHRGVSWDTAPQVVFDIPRRVILRSIYIHHYACSTDITYPQYLQYMSASEFLEYLFVIGSGMWIINHRTLSKVSWNFGSD